MAGHEVQAFRQNDQVLEKQETKQVSLDDFVSRHELKQAASQAAAGPSPEERSVSTKTFDGQNPIEIFEKKSNGSEQTVARGGVADPEVQAKAFATIHQAVTDGVHHQVAGDIAAANLHKKTPENTAAVRDAQGQAVLAASLNQGLPDAPRENDPQRAQQQLQRTGVA